MSASTLESDDSLQSQAEQLHMKVEIKDRKWRFKTYHHCFIGSEAIPIIIELELAPNVEKAIEFGTKLMECNLIAHVTNNHAFKNDNIFYTFTDKFYSKKRHKIQYLTPCRYDNKVSFMKSAKGFVYGDPKSKGMRKTPSNNKDDKVWNTFGSLSKSEFSFVSDRSSFAASLNTLSDANLWIVDAEQEKEQKLDFSNPENSNLQGFTFGNSSANVLPPLDSMHSMDEAYRQTSGSVASPSMSKRHLKSSSSITFSATVSLYTDEEKRQNSMLFFDLWGVPATDRPRDNSTSTTVAEPSLTSPRKTRSYEESVSATGGFALNRQPSTMFSAPIAEEDEHEWASSDDEEHSQLANNADAKDDSPQVTRNRSGFQYAKRKSNIAANFIFGRQNTNDVK